MRRLPIFLAISALLISCESTPESSAPSVFFESPEDGAEVTSPVEIRMGATGVDVVRAGVFDEGSGHFHILIDQEPIQAGQTVPSDSTHRHFGDGSSVTLLDLASGEHVLTLQMGDGAHAAIEGLVDEIRITVR